MKKTKRFISAIIVVILTILILTYFTNITERKYSVQKYHDFFEDDQDYDVLFLGSSHVIDGISPMKIWNDYGITSYNLGGHSNTIPTSYWILMNALDYTTPKVVVIDGYLLGSPYKISGDNYSSAHNSFDAFPLSMTKVKGIYDLMEDPSIEAGLTDGSITESEKRAPIGLLWDFSVYHTRWTELTEDDFDFQINKNKGAEDRVAVCGIGIGEDDSVAELQGTSVEYLDKIVEVCNSKGIKVLLVYLPARNGYQPEGKWLMQYAEKNNLSCIDFFETDCINTSIDYSDQSGHLNPSGANKVSDYIAEYLAENYGLVSHKDDSNYDSWKTDFEEYGQYKTDLLISQTNLSCYLMLLNESLFECKVTCDETFSSQYSELLNNISTLGECQKSIKNDFEYIDWIDAVPNAYIEVSYNNQLVDSIYVYNNSIYRE